MMLAFVGDRVAVKATMTTGGRGQQCCRAPAFASSAQRPTQEKGMPQEHHENTVTSPSPAGLRASGGPQTSVQGVAGVRAEKQHVCRPRVSPTTTGP